MQAFVESHVTKAALLTQLAAHAAADEIVKGQYWEKGKGCAVGCCVHGNDHMRFEPEFGIPWRVAWLADDLFECLDNGEAKVFAQDWIAAIPVGADLSRVYDAWCAWMLTDPKFGMVAIEHVSPCVLVMGSLFVRAAAGDEPSSTEWSEAARDARDAWAAWAARDAWAARAARDAWDAWAARAARDEFSRAAAAKFIELLAAAPVPAA